MEVQEEVEKKLITKAHQTFLIHEGSARVPSPQSHFRSKLPPTLLKTQPPMSTAGSQASHLYIYYIYTSRGDKGSPCSFPLHGFREQLSMLLRQAATSLFPRTHICVNGHAVIGSIAQLLFTYLGSRDGRKEKKIKIRRSCHCCICQLRRQDVFRKGGYASPGAHKEKLSSHVGQAGDISVAK